MVFDRTTNCKKVDQAKENYVIAYYKELANSYKDNQFYKAKERMAKDILELNYDLYARETEINDMYKIQKKFKRIIKSLIIFFTIYIIFSIIMIWVV